MTFEKKNAIRNETFTFESAEIGEDGVAEPARKFSFDLHFAEESGERIVFFILVLLGRIGEELVIGELLCEEVTLLPSARRRGSCTHRLDQVQNGRDVGQIFRQGRRMSTLRVMDQMCPAGEALPALGTLELLSVGRRRMTVVLLFVMTEMMVIHPLLLPDASSRFVGQTMPVRVRVVTSAAAVVLLTSTST